MSFETSIIAYSHGVDGDIPNFKRQEYKEYIPNCALDKEVTNTTKPISKISQNIRDRKPEILKILSSKKDRKLKHIEDQIDIIIDLHQEYFLKNGDTRKLTDLLEFLGDDAYVKSTIKYTLSAYSDIFYPKIQKPKEKKTKEIDTLKKPSNLEIHVNPNSPIEDQLNTVLYVLYKRQSTHEKLHNTPSFNEVYKYIPLLTNHIYNDYFIGKYFQPKRAFLFKYGYEAQNKTDLTFFVKTILFDNIDLQFRSKCVFVSRDILINILNNDGICPVVDIAPSRQVTAPNNKHNDNNNKQIIQQTNDHSNEYINSILKKKISSINTLVYTSLLHLPNDVNSQLYRGITSHFLNHLFISNQSDGKNIECILKPLNEYPIREMTNIQLYLKKKNILLTDICIGISSDTKYLPKELPIKINGYFVSKISGNPPEKFKEDTDFLLNVCEVDFWAYFTPIIFKSESIENKEDPIENTFTIENTRFIPIYSQDYNSHIDIRVEDSIISIQSVMFYGIVDFYGDCIVKSSILNLVYGKWKNLRGNNTPVKNRVFQSSVSSPHGGVFS